MKFIRDNVEYEGFKVLSIHDRIGPLQYVVLAWFEGDPELWLVENEAGYDQLIKMYNDEWGPDRATMVRLYTTPAPLPV